MLLSSIKEITNIYSEYIFICGAKKMKICVTATAGDSNAQVDPRFGRSEEKNRRT